jgi:hypothetical protein
VAQKLSTVWLELGQGQFFPVPVVSLSAGGDWQLPSRLRLRGASCAQPIIEISLCHDDAIRYLNEALRLLPEMPDSVERDRTEVALQGIRVPLLAAIHGFASAELAESLNRGLALCQRIGEGPELFTVMLGLWRFNLSRAIACMTRSSWRKKF